MKLKFTITFSIFAFFILNACIEKPQIWLPNSSELVARDYIKSNPQYSEFAKLVEVTGFESLLAIRGPYTIFIPDNDAMKTFYIEKGVSGIMDFDATYRANIVKNHLMLIEVSTNEIGLGALRDTNALGDFLITEFDGSDIILDKIAKIIKRNVRLANGYAHVVNKVIAPITKNIYTVLSEDPSYKLFSEGLKLTGIKDTLEIVSFPFGQRTARTRFTILAVPDTIFNRYGIYTINDLITWTGASPNDNLKSLNNPFYRYIEYHCLTGTYYLSDLNTQFYPILSRDNNVSMTINTDYKINFSTQTQKYTGFNIPASNTPTKNGALHAINDILPVIEPEPAEVLFETTDFFDFKQGDYYQKNYYMWYDGENSFAKIHWKGEFLQYYFQPGHYGMRNRDCIRMTGFWELSVTFPKVMKGKYNIIFGQERLDGESNFRVYLDGKLTPYVYDGKNANEQLVAVEQFETTSEHTITIQSINFGFIFWDYVKFVPVK